jgi:hypothetical protein
MVKTAWPALRIQLGYQDLLRFCKIVLNTIRSPVRSKVACRDAAFQVHQASAPVSALSGNCHVVGAGRNIFASSGGKKMESDPSYGRPRSMTFCANTGENESIKRIHVRSRHILTPSVIHWGRLDGLNPSSGQLKGPRSSREKSADGFPSKLSRLSSPLCPGIIPSILFPAA